MKHLKSLEESISENIEISQYLQYHLNESISIIDNVFRFGSDSYYNLLKESRDLFNNGFNKFSKEDIELFEQTDIGMFGNYNNKIVPLDIPIINEAEYKGREVKLNYPTRSSGPKKYKVYVKNPSTGNVKVVNFGDVTGGLTAKVSNPKARKAFASRHKCHLKKDKTKAGYWACRLNKYPHLWNGKTYPGYW
jgi:hypothetical protein